MKELARILAEAERLRAAPTAFALATVVKIEGSAYRRPGARMLITEAGDLFGTISGGCLEGEVAQHALRVLETGVPEMVVFEVDEDDPFLGFGSGCGGTVHVLIERIDPDQAYDSLVLVQRCLAARRPGVLGTLFGTPDGSRLGAHALWLDGAVYSTWEASLTEAVAPDAKAVLAERRPRLVHSPQDQGAVDILLELVRPPVHLLLFGDGPDVGPVAEVATTIGWSVTVLGRKPAGTLAMRFPAADHHVFLMHPTDVLDHIAIDERTAAVVMNHNLVRDQALLGQLLPTALRYVGALGPRRRTDRMLEALRDDGHALPPDPIHTLYAPIGLDLGTETPEEIALAVVAEVQAVLHGKPATMLREHDGPIHRAVPVTERTAPSAA